MKRALILLVLLLALLIAGSALLLTTGTGLRLASRIALPMLPGQITFDSLDGRLIGPLQITQLAWQDDGQRLTIERLDLDWHPVELASRHLHVDRFEASGVHWQSPAAESAESEPGEFALPELPIRITVGKLQVDDILIEQGTTKIPLRSVRLAGRLDKERYRIETLAVDSDALSLNGTAAIGVPPPHDIDTDLRWALRLEEQDINIEARTTAIGDTDQLALQVQAEGPFDLDMTGTASKLLDDPRIAGKLELNNLDPAIAGIDAQTGLLGATLRYAIATDRIELDGRIRAPDLLPADAIVNAAAGLRPGVIELQQVRMQLDDSETAIAASGSLHTDLSALDLELGWTDLAWPLGDEPVFSAPRGSIRLTGSPDRYQLELDASTAAGPVPAARLAIRGDGTSQHFDIANLDVSFEQGQLSGRGRLEWAGPPQARLELNGRNMDLGPWHDKLRGQVGFDSIVAASLPAEGPRVSIELRQIEGQLQDEIMAGSGSLDYAPGMIRLQEVDLRAGPARVQADGRIGEEIEMEWNLSVPDLGLLLPSASGSVRSQGTAGGQRSNPGLNGELVATAVKTGAFSASQIDGKFAVGIAADAAASIDLRAADVVMGALSLGTVRGETDGTVAAHSIAFNIDGPAGKLETTLRGGLTDVTWQGQIMTLAAARDDIGAWQIVEAAPLAIGRDRIELGQSCLVQAGARLCAGGDFSATLPWRSEFELVDLPLSLLALQLPADLVYDGAISGQGEVASTGDDWAGIAKLQLGDGRVLTGENGEDNILIAYENGLIETRIDPAGLRATLKLGLREAGLVDADITVPADAERALSGTVQARLENLSIVTAVLPQIGRIDGRLETNLALAGTRASPDFSGQIALQTTEMELPDLGITLTGAAVNVMTQGNELRFDGSAGSGDGELALSGDLRWERGGPRGQLRIDGDRFRIVDLPEIRLDASPAVTLTVAGQDIGIGGTLIVPAAEITPIDIGGGITVSPDQEIIGKAVAPEEKGPWSVAGSIEVRAGDAVHISGYGLAGRLTGSVLITETPEQPTIGRGAFEIVDGRYRAYGQELTIETGQLTFTGGPIDDPGLNLLATRTAGDVVAGAQVRGALRAPVLTLYSVPAMSDAQTMSYLITGRGLEELDEVDQTAVNDAAARLALRSGSVLASSLGRELGFDTVEFQDSGAVASTELVVGKHLSPRLYVSYGIGLFEAINTVRLRYRINSRLTLETQSGTRTSADLLYSVER